MYMGSEQFAATCQEYRCTGDNLRTSDRRRLGREPTSNQILLRHSTRRLRQQFDPIIQAEGTFVQLTQFRYNCDALLPAISFIGLVFAFERLQIWKPEQRRVVAPHRCWNRF